MAPASARKYASLDVRDNEEGNGVDLARQMLTQFKITDYVTPLGRMSGGQTKRAALARVLLSKPDMLILDEPTNHLDIDMIEWLEAYLSRQKMTLLMVTHDRYFLDKVCNKIIEDFTFSETLRSVRFTLLFFSSS